MVNFDKHGEGNSFWLSAVLGAVVATVLTVLPFSPILGGAASSYLRKDTDKSENIKVGAASGALFMIPGVLVFGLLFVFLGGLGLFTAFAGDGGAGLAFFMFIFAVIAVFAVIGALYTIGLGAVGGLLGHMLWEDDFRRNSGTYGGTSTYEDYGYDDTQYETDDAY
ncbi:DUF5518 domain-containing protein [Haloarchaeobius sp. DFWS5]|uniref:DUF5518 domain-containing protein n=1 Tax=Haloarchaeobius sp. DFWS5 TaxID=3446114 RepID=UPI003EBCB30A